MSCERTDGGAERSGAGKGLGKAEHVHHHVNLHVRSRPRQLRSESTQTAPHSCTFPTIIYIPPLLLHHRYTNARDTNTRYTATAALHFQAQACAFVIRPRRRHARLDARQPAPPARVALAAPAVPQHVPPAIAHPHKEQPRCPRKARSLPHLRRHRP
jgi:hypothetical protein